VKRGLITWDKTEIPAAVFDRRIEHVRNVLAERRLEALIVYSDLWRSNQARFLSNYMPYFNRALLIVALDFPPTLFCGLSPRVYGWIRSVTTIEDVRPAGNFAKPLFELATERKWTRIGALDFQRFPYDIHYALQRGQIEIANMEFAAVFRPAQDETELAVRRKAAALADRILMEELPNGIGLSDYEFVGRLEGRFRRAGAEDLIILLTNGISVPGPAGGERLEENFSVSVAMEYRGHWIRISRPQANARILSDCHAQWEQRLASREVHDVVADVPEALDRSYPYECVDGEIRALHIEYPFNGKKLFYGNTIV
jgi:hypothetical protein